jgi:hypothetical protein
MRIFILYYLDVPKKTSATKKTSKINSIDYTNTIQNLDNYLNTFSVNEDERKTLPLPTQSSAENDYNQFNTEIDEGLSHNNNQNLTNYNNTQGNHFRTNTYNTNKINILNELKNFDKIPKFARTNKNIISENNYSHVRNFHKVKYLPDFKADNLVKNILRGKLD